MKKILVANRGEIALRVIRSARECGFQSAAVHSPHDRSALYVREADESYQLQGNLPSESYLDQEQIIAIAQEAKADAIHPGYGFLSENPEFAAKLEREGITFIGPTPQAIEQLGDKTSARKLAKKLGVPTPTGTVEALKDHKEAITVAKQVGYPVLLKAAAGGGGKGMRIVEHESELKESLERAKGEALMAFGDDRVYVEKYLVRPRHIEIQVLADTHGNAIHLGERECSIQRRHQKLVEEAPSTILTPKMRKEMGEAAVALVREAKYRGAGTVEFLLDQEGKYFFLEVNTRLQVEHPVTEFITGLDLVREQFRIASGERLSMKQEDVKLHGHAIEVRIQAEDTWNDFLPSLGTIHHIRHASGAFVRNDSSLFSGLEVSGYYDSLLAKLVVWDLDRPSAIERMKRALAEMRVAGVSTTIPFAEFVMENDRFKRGELSTGFVAEEFTNEVRLDLEKRYEARLLPYFARVAQVLNEVKLRKGLVFDSKT